MTDGQVRVFVVAYTIILTGCVIAITVDGLMTGKELRDAANGIRRMSRGDGSIPTQRAD